MTPALTCTPSCPAPRHHTMSAYHDGCRSPAARQDHYLYTKRRRTGQPWRRTHDATGTRHRIQALYAIGHTATTIAQHTGLHPRVIQRAGTGPHRRVTTTTRQLIADAYLELRHTPGTSTTNLHRAQHRGWPTPDEWDAWGPDHIDTPDDPTPVIDPVAIQKVINRQLSLDNLTPAEHAHLYTTLTRQNLTHGQIRHRLGLSAAQVTRLARHAQQHAERTTT